MCEIDVVSLSTRGVAACGATLGRFEHVILVTRHNIKFNKVFQIICTISMLALFPFVLEWWPRMFIIMLAVNAILSGIHVRRDRVLIVKTALMHYHMERHFNEFTDTSWDAVRTLTAEMAKKISPSVAKEN